MSLSTIFANLPSGNNAASLIDTNMNQLGAMAITACTASGTNAISLSSNSNQPSVTSYANYQQFSFVAAATSTASVTINVNSIGALSVFNADGSSSAANDFLSGVLYVVAYNSALNSGGGGFQKISGNIFSSNNSYGGFINKFRNGTMDVWQRGTGSITVSTSGAYTADGWIVVPTGASCTAQQTAGRASTLFALKVTGAASITDILVKQRIESYLAAQLYPNAAAQVTVQAKVYNNTGGSITPTLTVKHAGSTDNWGSPVTDVNAVSLQACPNTTLTQVAYTFTSASGTANGLEVTFDFGNNFSTTGKDVEISELDIRITPSLVTGINSNPPPPELRNIQYETALCQRYLPAFIASDGLGDTISTGLSFSTTQNQAGVPFMTQARVNPTGITVTSATSFKVTNGSGSGISATSITFAQGSIYVGQVTITVAAGLTAGQAGNFFANASTCSILFTGAEL